MQPNKKTMSTPKISVIVPVYNAEKSLCRCIESILAQTYQDFELLLIDDGSKDSSGAICDEYAEQDARIRVFHKENGGVSSARNVGLDNARGEWYAFVDSDDSVSPHYLKNSFKHISENVDLVFSYATQVDSNGISKKEQYPSRLVSADKIEIAFVENDLSWHTSPWSKLYRSEIIRKANLRFDVEMHIGEDLVFLYSYIMFCKQICFTSDTDYYYYYNNDNSLTKRVNSFHSELYGLNKINEILDILMKGTYISNAVALEKISWIRGSYTGRVLNALYHESGISRGERIKTIKGLDLSPFFASVKQNSLKGKLLLFLLRHKLIWLYDNVREIKSAIRK